MTCKNARQDLQTRAVKGTDGNLDCTAATSLTDPGGRDRSRVAGCTVLGTVVFAAQPAGNSIKTTAGLPVLMTTAFALSVALA